MPAEQSTAFPPENGGLGSAIGFSSSQAVFAKLAFQWNAPPDALRIIKRLLDGNRRFVENRPHCDGHDRDSLKPVENGQDPDVIAVTCSDSRNNPAIIFDLGIGDVFEIESAGGVVVGKSGGAQQLPSAQIGTIEFMVSNWVRSGRTGVLLILGHTKCGAVDAAIKSHPGQSSGSPHLDALVEAVRDNIPADVKKNPGHGLERAVRANSAAILDSILCNSQIVREAVEKGHVIPLQGIFELETGEVHYVGAIETWVPAPAAPAP